MCARCEELEEEVAYLKSELGIQRDATNIRDLAKRFGLRPSAVKIMLVLYRAKGGLKSKLQLLDSIPPKWADEDERSTKIVDVMICMVRRSLGRDAIDTAWGHGWRMTPAGMARVAAALGDQPQSVAA